MKGIFSAILFSIAILSIAQQPGIAINELTPGINACTPVKDQYMSGTCWSFSVTSMLESELLKMGKGEEDISEMFIARHSMVRKIRRHLQLKGANYFTPGGQFHDAVWVMKNFGLVPEEVYSGKGRNEQRHNHAEMDTLLSTFVRSCLANGITKLSTRQQAFVDSVLDHYLGKVPAHFGYRGRTYTPRSYLEQYLGIDPDDYVEITSYTHHPFYSGFVLEDKYNWTGDAYWNVPLADFKRIADAALDKGYTVGWDGDADDPGFRYHEGLAYMTDMTTLTDLTAMTITPGSAERQEAFMDQSTLLNHMMHIVGRARKNGTNWYYVKNSWGNYSNNLGGYLFMREDYFLMRTVAIIVNKNAVPADIRQKLGF